MKIIFSFFLLLAPLFAIPEIPIPEGSIDIENFSIQVFIDPQKNGNLDFIRKKRFQTGKSRHAYSYQRGKDVWFRFKITNPLDTQKTLYLYHKEAYLFSKVIFYKIDTNGTITKQRFSRDDIVSQRAVPDASPTIRFTLKPKESATFYIYNRSNASIMSNIQILDRKNYESAHLTKYLYYAFLFGILVAIAFYNAFLFFTIRRAEYLFYVFFMIGSIAYQLYLSGVPLEFFEFNEIEYKRLIFGVSVLQLSLIIFTQLVLETKTRMPKIHKLLNYLLLLPGSILIAAFFVPIDHLLSIQAALAMIAAFTLLFVGLRANRMGISEAHYYLLSIGLYLIFAVTGILTFYGLLPYNNLTRNAFYFASLSEVFLLSLLLSYRIGLLRQSAIESERKLNDEIQSRNSLLKQKVEERTKALKELNSTLEHKINEAVDKIRQKDEDLLRQSRMAMMGEMLSMIAHQWRQPLATIVSVKNNMEVAIRLGELDEAELLQSLDDINTYAQYMSRTIDDFSNFFKPNKKAEPFDLADLLNTALFMMQSSFKNHNISVHKTFAQTTPITTYKNELLQVFLNIFKNAQDAFKERKEHQPEITISLNEDDKKHTISICDNAGGIPEEIIDKIFNPYFSTKEEKNGTGLGLYMSQTIIKEHCGGDIMAQNHDEGACFILKFFKNRTANLDRFNH